MHKYARLLFLNDWRMAVSEFGALTRNFHMSVSEFGGLWRDDITRFYCTCPDIDIATLHQHVLY